MGTVVSWELSRNTGSLAPGVEVELGADGRPYIFSSSLTCMRLAFVFLGDDSTVMTLPGLSRAELLPGLERCAFTYASRTFFTERRNLAPER